MLSTRPIRLTCSSVTRKAQISHQQVRHATLLRRPKRPYTFTQLITLSDGSTFLHRTTSPQPVYRSAKDTKNNAMWNPSSQKLLNVEEDDAGRLKRFRKRFGRGYDAESMGDGQEMTDGQEKLNQEEEDDSLLDLIVAGGKEEAKRGGKGSGGEK